MTQFEGDDAARLHTCLSVKTYFKFARDHADGGDDRIDEPSSDEDSGTEEEIEVLRQVQASRRLQRLSQAQDSSRTVRFAASTSTSAPTQHASNMGANRLQPSGSFPSLESVPPKIWASNWVPPPGCYRGQITSGKL